MAEAIDDRLRLYVERIERLREERRGIDDDIRDVFAELKAVGYDPKVVRRLIARRAMKPDDRAESDLVLEVYEAALGMGGGRDDLPDIEDLRPDAAALALTMLTADIVALEDAEQATALVDHVLFLLDLRAEIALLRQQEAERKKLAKGEGFDAKQIAQAVRWFEKCAKHGEDAMRLGEATFDLYRSTVETHRRADGKPLTEDAKLAAAFAPAKPTRPSKTTGKLAQLRADAADARRALGRG